MRRVLLVGVLALWCTACATTRGKPAPQPWDPRATELQRAAAWSADGRAAVAVGAQGWQATLSWRQQGAESTIHLAGPFGIGAVTVERTPQGIALNGAPPSADVIAQLQEKLGFELPLDDLRYWFLGVPNPVSAFELSRNDQDRARLLTQNGWSVAYDRYQTVAHDLLPTLITLSRAEVRVRIVVDRWEWSK